MLALTLGVALGGAIGATLRCLLDAYLPGGVLIANTVGSLAIGWLYGMLVAGSSWLTETTTAALTVGLIGALSTFATVSLRAAQLWTGHRRWAAVGLWSVHIVCGLLAASAGVFLSGAW
ncbi:fluoride efflux transporter FluC [Nesterenkonia alba]|uniref:fluoride efflux transporter FluC n=1 Tax=Nesterenkonia alba TaxID=515814 RepID=UPI0003B76CEF|nr:CrcB family protein [Nesterenkonia alba]